MSRLAVGAISALAAGYAGAALAHHGWSWAEEKQTELSGEVVEVYVGPPHPVITLAAEGDARWMIELGNPGLTAASGFDEDSASAGDAILVRGHRSLNQNERRMKAVRITVEGRRYDIYPDRIIED